jgi:hypothetical protein
MQLERLKLTYVGAIVLVVISLGLFAVQATVWVKATAHAKSETATQISLGVILRARQRDWRAYCCWC